MLCACGGPIRWLLPPANRILCGPAELSRTVVRHILDGPLRADCSNITCTQWAHAKASPGLLAGCCGPTRVSWQRPSIRIAGQYYAGPRGSSAWQPIMLLMGQCKKNVLNIAAYNWPMREHVQHFVMGLYEYMRLLQRLGPRCFFRGIRLYCTWVLPTTTTMYATRAQAHRVRAKSRTFHTHVMHSGV